MTTHTDVDAGTLHAVCGRWATGVAVVSGTGTDGRPFGMAVSSFTSVSLDPPLVLFCPARSSTTWPELRDAGRFAIDILAREQGELARSFARSGGDKFAGVALRYCPDGLPALAGAVARLVCEVEAVHPAGDHEIAVGRVLRAEQTDGIEPLLFHRGRTVDSAFG